MRYLLICLALLVVPAAVFADQPDRILFPHDLHFENEVECANCHEGAVSSATPADRLLPDMEVCADCHEIDDDENCSMCHTNLDEAGDYHRQVFGAANFAHAPHLDRDLTCGECHGDPAAARPVLPGKPDCRGCHETADDYADCRLCHGEKTELRPANHGETWISGHGLLAHEDQGLCAQCHTQTTCQECHAGDNVRPRSHRLNYAFEHALEARGNELQCATCHLEPEYCSSCHIAERVLPTNHSQSGWVLGGGGGRHATEGLFNMESCIACHSTGAAEPSCARCHGGE
jgi:hypothetical protein